MKRIHIYVEGPSDVSALKSLLAELIIRKSEEGKFIEIIGGNFKGGKRGLIVNLPKYSVNLLKEYPTLTVIALPDLYPYNIGCHHTSLVELETWMTHEFLNDAKRKNVKDPLYLSRRFKIFCLKHDLEVLLLAARNELMSFLKKSNIKTTFKIPVEDQNNNVPPAIIVQTIFKETNREYKKTTHAMQILNSHLLPDIRKACPQCFNPFVEFLESI